MVRIATGEWWPAMAAMAGPSCLQISSLCAFRFDEAALCCARSGARTKRRTPDREVARDRLRIHAQWKTKSPGNPGRRTNQSETYGEKDNSCLVLRSMPVITRQTNATWDFSPRVAADGYSRPRIPDHRMPPPCTEQPPRLLMPNACQGKACVLLNHCGARRRPRPHLPRKQHAHPVEPVETASQA